MREILFRGKRVRGGEWVFGSFVSPNRITAPIGEEIYASDIVSSETVGQFTGLYDKNGKRIFEGDIVSSNKRKTWIGMGEVWFGNSAFWCGEREWAKLLRVVCLEDEQAEVIGNIHDNPELLEE